MKAKTKSPLALSASNVDTAHDNAVKSRRNLKQKQTLFFQAKIANQEAEDALVKAKDAHELNLIDKH